ncbi:MAG: hypothetical protein QM296_13455 [Bacillota bacterium]|nr:hypothetical protein [Bacillota bacterium]
MTSSPKRTSKAQDAREPRSVYIEPLLKRWCDGLLRYEVTGMGQPHMDGNLLCPSCVRIHGRAIDAVFPLLVLSKRSGDSRYVDLARRIFNMTELVYEREDGSNVNDVDTNWRAITVFAAIALADALNADKDGNLLPEIDRKRWVKRLERMGDFLRNYPYWEEANANYQITKSLALAKVGLFFGRRDDLDRARATLAAAWRFLTPDNLIFGEGRPFDRRSPKGCLPIDIGYNVEESAPALAEAALLVGDAADQERAAGVLRSHARFLLDDGGWDNSFGSRAFKWSWWGSRTADGAALAYLLYSDRDPSFAEIACRCLAILEDCTGSDGLLMGGRRYDDWGEPSCIHHTFTHAKILAALLEHGTEVLTSNPSLTLPRYEPGFRSYVYAVDSLLVTEEEWTATISGYDWIFLPEGHPSGGDLTLLKPLGADPLLVATMNKYVFQEPHNMQQARLDCHRPLTPRLVLGDPGDDEASSLYGTTAPLFREAPAPTEGLKALDIDGTLPDGTAYRYRYTFEPDKIRMDIRWDGAATGTYVLPLIVDPAIVRDKQEPDADGVRLRRRDGEIILKTSGAKVSWATDHDYIYNLVGGFMARELHLTSETGQLSWTLEFRAGV